MNFGLEGVTRFSPVPDDSHHATYSASFSKRFGILSSPPLSPVRKIMDLAATAGSGLDATLPEPNLSSFNPDRRVSEGDSCAVIQYEDCTGAAYRIRKGISRTPLQVRP